MNSPTTAEEVKLSPEFKHAARAAVLGTTVYGSRGRTDRPAAVTWQTPVKWIVGDAAPVVKGLPYWKTGFSNGRGFSKTLYTPSTLRIVVGIDWKHTK